VRPVRRVAAAALASALALSACTSGQDDVELSYVPSAPEDDELRVVGVLTQDRPRQGLAAAAGLDVTFPSVVDEQGAVLRSLGLQALPATVFLRADGTVAHTYVGPALDEATVRRLAAEHLGVPA
jgi:hypothetical protein